MTVRSAVRQEAKALWGGGTGLSLAAVAGGWGLLVGTRMILPVIIPSLQESYGLSLTVAGSLVTVLWLFGSLGQLPGGILADRYSERTLLAVSAVLVAGAIGLVVAAGSSVVLFVATAVWGVGHSLYPVARITLLSNLYTERVGSALGVTMAAGDVGQTVLPPLASAIAVAAAWQAGLGFVAPVLVLAGLAILVVVPASDDADSPSTGGSLRETLAVVDELRKPSMGFMALILFLYLFIWQSFTAFYPTYLTSTKGLSPSVASLLFGSFFAVGVVMKPLAGVAYDRVGTRGTLVGVLLPPIAGFLALPFVENVWLLAVITALVSTMLGSGAVTQSFLAEAFSETTKGAGLGVVRTITATLAAGGPLVFGAVADAGYFDEGYLALAVIMAGVVLLTLRMPQA